MRIAFLFFCIYSLSWSNRGGKDYGGKRRQSANYNGVRSTYAKSFSLISRHVNNKNLEVGQCDDCRMILQQESLDKPPHPETPVWYSLTSTTLSQLPLSGLISSVLGEEMSNSTSNWWIVEHNIVLYAKQKNWGTIIHEL